MACLDTVVSEVCAKAILSRSKVFDYTINPYVGCEHGCSYCYARFIKRFTGHKERWGEFVDVKINAAVLLQNEIRKKKIGRVWISGVCDPYQPLEKKYKITRRCLEILSRHCWPVTVQTKSVLVLRDLELLRGIKDVEVGFSIPTSDDSIRMMFEPKASSIGERIDALEKLHLEGIKTFAMVAPMLPNVEALPSQLAGKVDYVLVDKMNYHDADWVYRKHNLKYASIEGYFNQKKKEIASALEKEEMQYRLLF